MSAFGQRAVIYKVVLVLIYLTFLIYGLAFGIPFWFGPDPAIVGLWITVKGDDFEVDDVSVTGFGEGPDWFEGVRGCWVGGAFFYVVGIIYSLVENCRAILGKDYGVSGFLFFLAGLCGSAGVIVTAIKIHDDDVLDEFRWGFYIACISSGLVIIFSIILLICRNAINDDSTKSSRTADYVYAHKHTGPYAQEYINAGYRGDELPLVNGVSHSMYRGSMAYGNGYPSAPRMEAQPSNYNPTNYNPYGYKEYRPGNRSSVAESTDLSNGYTNEIIQAEQALGQREDYGRSAFGQNGAPPRNDYYYGRGF